MYCLEYDNYNKTNKMKKIAAFNQKDSDEEFQMLKNDQTGYQQSDISAPSNDITRRLLELAQSQTDLNEVEH